MATQPGVAGTMFRALAEKGINIQMITTSEIKISVLVARESARRRCGRSTRRFDCTCRRPTARGPATAARGSRKPDAAKLVARLQRMEKLIIEGIDLDESQARVTFVGLPDMPGLAAKTFDALAEAGIVVDMIVQSIGRENRANISVTVPRKRLAEDHRSGRRSGQGAGLRAADLLRQGGQAVGVRRGHARATRAWPPGCSSRWPTRASTSR